MSSLPDGAEADGRITSDVEDGIGWITFDNPTRHNALTADMMSALPAALDSLAARGDVRVVILRGAGEKAFVSGADIRQIGTSGPFSDRPIERAPAARSGSDAVAEFALPVIAMIHGYCLGGGLSLALAADLRLCSDDAVFSIPAGRLGGAYSFESASRLVQVVGRSNASDLLFTARRVAALEAVRIGLVNRCVPKKNLAAEVLTTAKLIAANAPLSHRAHKRALQQPAPSADERRGIDAAVAAAWTSADAAEGRQAFLDRRAPVFRGV